MNILFLNAKRRWCGVITLYNKIAETLISHDHKVFMISRKRECFNSDTFGIYKLSYLRFGMDYNLLLMLKLVRYIKRNNIDLIITNVKKEVIVGGIAAKLCGIKNIRIIGNERDFERNFTSNFIYKHFVDKFIVPCEFTKDQVIKRCKWINSQKLKTVYNGIDPV